MQIKVWNATTYFILHLETLRIQLVNQLGWLNNQDTGIQKAKIKDKYIILYLSFNFTREKIYLTHNYANIQARCEEEKKHDSW